MQSIYKLVLSLSLLLAGYVFASDQKNSFNLWTIELNSLPISFVLKNNKASDEIEVKQDSKPIATINPFEYGIFVKAYSKVFKKNGQLYLVTGWASGIRSEYIIVYKITEKGAKEIYNIESDSKLEIDLSYDHGFSASITKLKGKSDLEVKSINWSAP